MNFYPLPIGRKEVVVRGDGNCFYGAIALAIDGKSGKDLRNTEQKKCNILKDFGGIFSI